MRSTIAATQVSAANAINALKRTRELIFFSPQQHTEEWRSDINVQSADYA